MDILSKLKLTPEDSLSTTTRKALSNLTFKGRKLTVAMRTELTDAGFIDPAIQYQGYFVACGKQIAYDITNSRIYTF